MDLTQRYDPELVAALQAFPIDEMINWNLPQGSSARRVDPEDSSHLQKQSRRFAPFHE
jgi:hypothetical protein